MQPILSKEIKKCMVDKDINMTDLANMTGYSKAYISSMLNEDDERNMGMAFVMAVSNVLGVKLSTLIARAEKAVK